MFSVNNHIFKGKPFDKRFIQFTLFSCDSQVFEREVFQFIVFRYFDISKNLAGQFNIPEYYMI